MATRRILIIDDEETIQTVVQFGIRMTVDWDVLTAATGAEGMAIAHTEHPDVILLDVMLPDMDGMAIVNALHKTATTTAIPIILLTATVPLAEPHQCSHLGVSGVITKPFNSLHLPAQICRLLRWEDAA